MKNLALVALGISFLASVANVVLGFQLSRDLGTSSELHLALGILILVAGVASGLYLLKASVEYIESAIILTDRENLNLKRIKEQKDRAAVVTFLFMALSLLSLISGSISQSGRFPLLHGVCGLAVAVVSGRALLAWIRFFKEFHPVASK